MSKFAKIAVWPGAKTRDLVAQQTRYLICDRWGFIPFWHQADVWAAADGLELSGKREKASTLLECWRADGNTLDIEPRSGYPACLKFGDGSLYWLLQDDQKRIYYEKLIKRIQGIARVLALLASYKAGKSAGIALYAASFGLVDGFICEFIGLQYDTSEPEFLYVRDFLLRERGLNLKSSRYAMTPRTGDMEIVIADSQARFRSRSFKEAQALEGKERDMYCLPTSTKIWMGDYSFKNIEDVRLGDEVIGWRKRQDDEVHMQQGKNAKPGGAFRTDKLIRTRVSQLHSRSQKLIRVTMESGRTVVCTVDHRWLTCSAAKVGPNGEPRYSYQYYVSAKLGRRLAHIVQDPGAPPAGTEYLRGWLAGMYDGEGSRTIISQYEGNHDGLRSRLQLAFHELGFDTTAEFQGVRWLGGREEALRFLLWIDPHRYRGQYADEALLCSRFRKPDLIVKIEELPGTHAVYCLGTQTHNFVADGYGSHNCFTESYQTGGLRPYDELSQNLGARDGIALFPSTRKRPCVEVLHKHGHSSSPEFDHFHCTCDIDRSENPYAHDARARAAAKLTMTRERYAVAWEGKPGTYLGSVYEYTLGDREIPICEWMPAATITSLVIPQTWVRWCGIDFGSHYAALFCGFDPLARVRALAEVANYHYVSGEIEFRLSMSLDVWARQVLDTAELLKGRWRYFGDANLQMRRELRNTYGIHIEVGMPDLELRCDITRTFFQHDRILIAPWLVILPEEIERAKFPPHGTNSTGYYRRVKGDDHMLDCLEHPCGKRGQGKVVPKEAPASPLRELIGNARLKDPRDCWDPHLGA